MPVITIGGPVAGGAREVGRLVAGMLELDYVDQQILVDAARRLGVSVAAVADRDERTMSLGERLANLLRTFLERSAVAGAGDPLMSTGGLEMILARTYAEAAGERSEEVPFPDDAHYIATVTAVIQELAQRGNIVILGRGSQVILQEHPGAFHVLAIAPQELRVKRFAQRENLSLEKAAKQVAEIDRGRLAFHHKFFKVDADDPRLYHLVLNTGRLSYEQAAQAVASAAQALAGAP